MTELENKMLAMGAASRQASHLLAKTSSEVKNAALRAMAQHILKAMPKILSANAVDMQAGRANDLAASALDRLLLNEARVRSMADGLELIASLPDPIGTIMDEWVRPNGLKMQRVRQPLGVIGVIYESRPNVTADAAALTLKAGNAVILRGGSDSLHSSRAIHECLIAGLVDAGLPASCVSLVPSSDRACVGMMLKGLNQTIDVIIPRGGKSLVALVQEEARVPVFAHLDGNCHVYVEKSASLEMALSIVKNAKLRRTGVCGAAETLLSDDLAHLTALVHMLLEEGVEVRGCLKTQAIDKRVKPASAEDYATEFLDKIIAVKLVADIDEAIAHINHYSSSHTEAIVTEDERLAEQFFAEIHSAIILHNASTQFADGGEFGFGAEIGIATGKMHARGPVGVEQLTTFHYRIHGTGQIRP